MSCPSMAARIGRPALPPGSPSSLKRYCAPHFQAQQLCPAEASRWAAMNACASSSSATGAAMVWKRLLRISSRYSARPCRVLGIAFRPPAGQSAALEDDPHQVVGGGGEVLPGHALAAGDQADLAGEVGVVLGAAPEQEDQVHGIHRVHPAGGDPGLEYRGAAAEPAAVVLVEMRGEALAAADDLHGEDPRGQRVAAGELHLGADVAGQRLGRIVVDAEGVEGTVPEFEDVAQHRRVEAQLVAEVVVQVGLGQADVLRDGVHAGALEAVAGELLLGRGEDRLLVLLADAPGRLVAGGRVVGGHCQGHAQVSIGVIPR